MSTFPPQQQQFPQAPQFNPAPQPLPGVADLGGLGGGQFAPPPMPGQYPQQPQQQYQDPVMANFPPSVQQTVAPAIPAEQLQQNGMQQQFHQPQLPPDFGPQPNYQQQAFQQAPPQPAQLPPANFAAPPVAGYQAPPAQEAEGKLTAKDLADKVKAGEFDNQLDALWQGDERATVRKAVEARKSALSGVPAPQSAAPAPVGHPVPNPGTIGGPELSVLVPVPLSRLQAVLAAL